jgi:hypothetical protein
VRSCGSCRALALLLHVFALRSQGRWLLHRAPDTVHASCVWRRNECVELPFGSALTRREAPRRAGNERPSAPPASLHRRAAAVHSSQDAAKRRPKRERALAASGSSPRRGLLLICPLFSTRLGLSPAIFAFCDALEHSERWMSMETGTITRSQAADESGLYLALPSDTRFPSLLRAFLHVRSSECAPTLLKTSTRRALRDRRRSRCAAA